MGCQALALAPDLAGRHGQQQARHPHAHLRPAVHCGLQVKLRDGDLSWQAFLASGTPEQHHFKPHVAAAEDWINILFSSGTTGGVMQ